MNLAVLVRSRKRPTPGDVFVFKIDSFYRFGLVVSAKIPIGGIPKGILIYLYDYVSESPSLDKPLTLDHLLIPPIITHDELWKDGYFMNVTRLRSNEQQLLAKHCFVSLSTGKLFDENGERMSARVEPCGIYGLTTERGVDEEISKALGLRIPTDEEYLRGAGADIEDDEDEDACTHFVQITFVPDDLNKSPIEDLSSVEEALDAALADGPIGEWSGNGLSQDLVHIDVEIDRGSLEEGIKRISRVLRRLQAPASTYLLIDGKRRDV
jgi:hypothetical protein